VTLNLNYFYMIMYMAIAVKYVFFPQVLVNFGISPSSKFYTNFVLHL